MTTRRVFLLGVIMLTACCLFTPFELRPEHIVVSDPLGFVRDAQSLMEKHKPGAFDHEWIEESRLPVGLRIPKVVLPRGAFLASVLEAEVAADHLDLVLIRHTDGYGGARVWAANSRPHRDAPTRYKDIYLFMFSKEEAESAANVP